MSDFLNRKKVRGGLIKYFKVISKCQKQIQTIQQKLISHPRFNPIVLYRKYSCFVMIRIAKGERMTVKDLKEYWRKKGGVHREEGIRMYVIKYDLKKRDTDQITLDTYFVPYVNRFLQTLIPYTPNCLREVNQTIFRQLQTQHMDMTVQSIYHKLILTATECLYMVRLLQRQIGLMSWQKVQAFMVQDIVEKGKRIDLTIKETTDVIYVRKWMELWVGVDQYEVLNMMRFFNGGDELMIMRMFDNGVTIHMKCTCQHHNSVHVGTTRNQAHLSTTHIGKQTKSQSKLKPKKLNEDYYSSEQQSQKSKSRHKMRFYTYIQGHEKHNTQTETQQRHHVINTSEQESLNQNPNAFKNQLQQVSSYQPNNGSNSSNNLALNLFISYMTILVDSQKQISFNRMILLPHKKQVQEILHDVLSKKNNYTSCEKILLYIQKFITIKKDNFQRLVMQMGNTKISNSVVFSLFNQDKNHKKYSNDVHKKYNNDKNDKQKQLTPNQIMQTLTQLLYKFISTKNKLISTSQKLVKFPINQIVSSALKSIDQQRNKSVRIKMEQLKELFMKNTLKPIGKHYLALLMDHLGDGNEITAKTLIQVFLKQTKNLKQKKKAIDDV